VPLKGVWLLEKAEGWPDWLEKQVEWDVRDYLIHERDLGHNSLREPLTARWFYSVDFEGSPHTIDFNTIDRRTVVYAELVKFHGILKIEGNRLTVCFCDVSFPRPTGFKWEGDAYSLLLFRKVSDERHELRGVAGKLAEMIADPKKCLSDPTKAEDPDFLEMLGYAFARGGRERLGWLSRVEAVAHLRRCLASADWMAVLQAVTALERIGCKQEAPSIIPLLRHPDEMARLAAAEYLHWSPDRRAVRPLCEALDKVEKDGDLGYHIGSALAILRDPAAAPSLERAVKRGIRGDAEWALGAFGGESAFEPLLDGVEKRDSMSAVEGLRNLIRRSNKKPEPWMEKVGWSEEAGLTEKAKWRKWWEANKADFKVIKTADEAFRQQK
jgi:hypothetical protein